MKIAVIGLGAMGLPIARRLGGAEEIELAVFDLDAGRLATADGIGRTAASAADAARDADAVFTILPADRHVEAVAADVGGAPGRVFADFSTIGPQTIERVAERLAADGSETVSVAITRGAVAAAEGRLALYVGGDPAAAEALRPAFDAVATEVRHTGGLASAKAVKIANNMVVACLNVAICEALVLGARLGVDARTLTDGLAAGGADSWALRNQIVACVLGDDLGPGHFSTVNMAKDVALFLEMAEAHGTQAQLAGAAAAAYRGTIAHGFGEHYHPVVVRWLERCAGDRPPVDGGDALPELCRAVVAVQQLASLAALQALEPTGIVPTEAEGHLTSGSAGNESLATVAATMRLDGAALAADLGRVLALADRAAVPCQLLETARHAALAL
jgi:3-hydroxyisobutyrate dehydrogenase-like beta-hydroxyacid dehydrogenase